MPAENHGVKNVKIESNLQGRVISALAHQFGQLSSVKAVALAGSRGTGRSDGDSDYDLYVYSELEIPIAIRRELLGQTAEIDNRFWEPGDESVDPATGVKVDIMYRTPAWIENQLDRVLVRHEASVGYSTCFWFNVLYSTALVDPDGWYGRLQNRAKATYPPELRKAVIAKNWPILRKNQSSYKHQIELALRRSDDFGVHHRVTALLASFFDIWFALQRMPHPGEKRLLTYLPELWAERVRQVLERRSEGLLPAIDQLLDPLDEYLRSEELIRTNNGADDRT